MWPPPPWQEVIIMWDTMLKSDKHNPNEIVEWVNTYPGGEYHLHGFKSTEGFAFRFKDPKDAVIFKLRWL